MGVNVLRSCQTNSGGLEHVLHQHTKSGLSCQEWSQQIPHKHNYPSVDHNFCRYSKYFCDGVARGAGQN